MLADGTNPRNRAVHPASEAGLHLTELGATGEIAAQSQTPTATEKRAESVPQAAAPTPNSKTAPHPFKPLPQFRVLLHNDDLTEMGHVVRSIIQLTFMPPARAYVVMMTAHTRGVALVTITHRERAELYQQQFRNKGLIVTIEAAE